LNTLRAVRATVSWPVTSLVIISWALGTPSSSVMADSARELLVGAGRREAERADALGDQIHGEGQLVVLGLEHEVQRLEHRAR
jgi:hypothetical protein